MSELTELLGKIKLEGLMGFMIYDSVSGREAFENYEQEIEKSYDKFFGRLERLYSEVNRKDEKLFDAVADFAMLHDDIYFEVGVLIGFQLFKNLEQGYQRHSKGSLKKSLSNGRNKKNIMQQIVQYRMDTALEETLRTDKEYQESIEKFDEKMKLVDRNKFSSEQWEIVDEVLSSCNDKSSEYGRMAYQQGLSDAVNLFKDVLLLM